MKNWTTALLTLLTIYTFAQQKNTISAIIKSGVYNEIGLSFEHQKDKKIFNLNNSQIFNLTRTELVLFNANIPTISVKGSGFIGEFGYRLFFNKQKFNRWYVQNSVSAGYINFDDTYNYGICRYNYTGTFSFVSIIQPEIGFKACIGRFCVDTAIGYQWNIELKSQGEFNNQIVDNTFIKAGIKVGYMF
jgi:hypothetical protein